MKLHFFTTKNRDNKDKKKLVFTTKFTKDTKNNKKYCILAKREFFYETAGSFPVDQTGVFRARGVACMKLQNSLAVQTASKTRGGARHTTGG